jgi:hypothetical protein
MKKPVTSFGCLLLYLCRWADASVRIAVIACVGIASALGSGCSKDVTITTPSQPTTSMATELLGAVTNKACVTSFVVLPDDLRYGPDADIVMHTGKDLADMWTLLSESKECRDRFTSGRGIFLIRVVTTPPREDGILHVCVNTDGLGVVFVDDPLHLVLDDLLKGRRQYRVFRCPELRDRVTAEWKATLARSRRWQR